MTTSWYSDTLLTRATVLIGGTEVVIAKRAQAELCTANDATDEKRAITARGRIIDVADFADRIAEIRQGRRLGCNSWLRGDHFGWLRRNLFSRLLSRLRRRLLGWLRCRLLSWLRSRLLGRLGRRLLGRLRGCLSWLWRSLFSRLCGDLCRLVSWLSGSLSRLRCSLSRLASLVSWLSSWLSSRFSGLRRSLSRLSSGLCRLFSWLSSRFSRLRRSFLGWHASRNTGHWRSTLAIDTTDQTTAARLIRITVTSEARLTFVEPWFAIVVSAVAAVLVFVAVTISDIARLWGCWCACRMLGVRSW